MKCSSVNTREEGFKVVETERKLGYVVVVGDEEDYISRTAY